MHGEIGYGSRAPLMVHDPILDVLYLFLARRARVNLGKCARGGANIVRSGRKGRVCSSAADAIGAVISKAM